jgi:Zn-dependent protease with chaperone function
MKEEKYESLVKRLELFAARNPSAYRMRVMLLAFLGYGYVYFVIAILVAICVGMVALVWFGGLRGSVINLIKVGWIPLLLLFLVARALFFRLPAPEGIELKLSDSPKLIAMVKELTKKLDCPQPDHVLLDGDFNASMSKIPRLGIFGWNKSYLTLGLPLMEALSPEQFRAVVAHEMGHLSGNHGKTSAWIYRVRMSWVRIFMEMQRNSEVAETFYGQLASNIGNAIFSIFFKWYAPFFSAYSFVLAREQEREADRAAVQLTGAKSLGEALINLDVKSQLLEREFWPGILLQANKQPEPPSTAFSQMFATLRGNSNAENAKQALALAMAVESSYEDTHPCLSERLAAMGHFKKEGSDDSSQLPPLPAPVVETAAQHFFGERANEFTERFNRQWQEQTGPHWRDRHRQVQHLRRRLNELETKAEQNALTGKEFWERIELTDEIEGNEMAVPLLKEWLKREPNDPKANFMLGSIFLSQKNESGIPLIERAMEREPQFALYGCQNIFMFLLQQGQNEEAEKYREKAMQHYQSLSEYERERLN